MVCPLCLLRSGRTLECNPLSCLCLSLLLQYKLCVVDVPSVISGRTPHWLGRTQLPPEVPSPLHTGFRLRFRLKNFKFYVTHSGFVSTFSTGLTVTEGDETWSVIRSMTPTSSMSSKHLLTDHVSSQTFRYTTFLFILFPYNYPLTLPYSSRLTKPVSSLTHHP